MPSTPAAMGIVIGIGMSWPGCWAITASSNDNIRSARFERQRRPLRFVVEPGAIGGFHVDELHVPPARCVDGDLRDALRIGACLPLSGGGPPPHHPAGGGGCRYPTRPPPRPGAGG